MYDQNEFFNPDFDFGIKKASKEYKCSCGQETSQKTKTTKTQDQQFWVNKETGEIHFEESGQFFNNDYYTTDLNYFKAPDIRDRSWGNVPYHQEQNYYNYEDPTQYYEPEYYDGSMYNTNWRNYGNYMEESWFYDAQMYEKNNWGDLSEQFDLCDQQMHDTTENTEAEKIKVDCEEIVNYDKSEYKEFIENNKFDRDQLKELSEVRRRGRNRIAARECRERKVGQIQELSDEINILEAKKTDLLQEKSKTAKEVKMLMKLYNVDDFDF